MYLLFDSICGWVQCQTAALAWSAHHRQLSHDALVMLSLLHVHADEVHPQSK